LKQREDESKDSKKERNEKSSDDKENFMYTVVYVLWEIFDA
jgi:hypothetical protein